MKVVSIERTLALEPIEPDPTSLIQALDTRSPRYTSYPSADRFVEAFDASDYARHLADYASTGRPLSLYVHIPFCESLCYYCGCNKKITRDHDKAVPYLQQLKRELELVAAQTGPNRCVSQLHWGGGTPTFLRPDEIRELMRAIHANFDLSPNCECSIEVDPRFASDELIDLLAVQGFNRMSIGVQDFDPMVQKAVNRVQPPMVTQRVVESARGAGFGSLNFDLIYGLPLQTIDSFVRTIDQVIQMKPDRIALYNYAHMPTKFAAQRQIRDVDLPCAQDKMDLFANASMALEQAGYEYIGMDHFALPTDELAIARRRGTLHRNFQGYTTQPDCDLIGLGASAISRVGDCYSQNHRSVRHYCEAIDQGQLAAARGIELCRDDLLRRAVISALMCQGELSKQAISIAYLIDFDVYFEDELNELEQYVQLNLMQINGDSIEISEQGRRKALRAICAVFDKHLQSSKRRSQYSKIL